MRPWARAYLAELAGFLIALIFAGVTLTILNVVGFQPGEEFRTPWQEAGFTLVLWWVVAPATSGAGFAVGLTLTSLATGRVPMATVLGLLGGLAVAGLLAFGVVSGIGRRLDLSILMLTVATGFAAGLCVSALGLVASRMAARGAAA